MHCTTYTKLLFQEVINSRTQVRASDCLVLFAQEKANNNAITKAVFFNLYLQTNIDLLNKISMKSYRGSNCLKEIAHSSKSIIHSLSLLWGVLEMFIVALNP